MNFRADLALRSLQQLERQRISLRHCNARLDDAHKNGDPVTSIRAVSGAKLALERMADELVWLRRQVTHIDGLGKTVESSDELIMRVVRLIIATQVAVLHQALIASPGIRRMDRTARAWAERLGDMLTFLESEAARITNAGMSYRSGVVRQEAMPDRPQYREAIRTALSGIKCMFEEPEISCFLTRGAALANWPEAAGACGTLLALAEIDFQGTPDQRLWMSSMPLSP